MRRSIVICAMLAGLAATARADDGLSIRSKSLVAAGARPDRHADAPFRSARDPLPELLLREEQERRGPRGACEYTTTAVCYDLAGGHIVYRPARNYMPRFEGLRAESVSLRRDRIIFRYSFR